MRRPLWWVVGGLILVAIVALVSMLAVEQFVPPRKADPATSAASPTATPHITATLFYMAPGGQALQPVRRDVPLAKTDGTPALAAQGAQILNAQLAAPPSPYVSVIPKGTTLRAFYVTEQGDAFVDLSPEVTTAHPGGSLAEMLTVYAIVNAVTANLRSVQRVQILVGGKESETIAGHVDVRRPLAADLSYVKTK